MNMDPPDSTTDRAMRAGMEGLIAAMKDRPPAVEASEPASEAASLPGAASDGKLAAAPWRAVRLPSPDRDEDPADWASRRGLAQGSVVGRYVVIKKLGAGAMGVVYSAFDPELDRKVALKLLLPGVDDDERRDRLRREAQALGKLAHPNIVAVHDVGAVGEQVWLALEFVQGRTLAAWLAQPRGWREVVRVMRSAGKGLAAAHTAGLLHRDFKPENVMVGDDGRVRVMDFGLARVGPEGAMTEADPSQQPTAGTLAMQLTDAGATVGTPSYMAPEQFDHAELTTAADQFAFCVTLWEALYGKRPFGGRSLEELAANVRAGGRRPPPKDRRVPNRLRLACERGLSVDPRQRWPSMEALLAELWRISVPRTRRWLALGVTGGLVALGGGLALTRYVEVMDRCTGARAQLEGIWDDAKRQQVKAAILGTQLVYAPGTWERVEQRLDGYADAWADKHTEVCEATRVTAEQTEAVMDLRMGCLRGHRTALNAAIKVLGQADAEVVENAVELVSGLPMSTRCDDVELLEQQRQRVPPPEDPRVAQEVEELRERLADSEAEDGAGKYAHALERVEPLVRRAEALGYPPLLAEAKLWRGDLLEEVGKYAAAEQDLQAAYSLALQHQHDEVAMRAAQLLTFVVGYQQARHAESLVWGQTALPLAERRGEGPDLAVSLNNLGIVLNGRGEYEQAELYHRRALRIDEQVLGADALGVATSSNNLGNVLENQGEYEQARLHYQRALEIYEEALGANHPDVAMSSTNLGSVLDKQGKYAQAELHLRRALQLREELFGADHPNVASSSNSLGNVLKSLGDHEQAELHYRRALRIYEKVQGANHPDVAGSLNNLGTIYEVRGEYAQAEIHHRRALRILEEALGPDHPDVAYAATNLGNSCFNQGKHEQAELHLRRALELREERLSADHPDVADALNNLAIVFHGQGKHDQAELCFQRVLQIYEKAFGADHPAVAYGANNLGAMAYGRGEYEQAELHFQRALRIQEEAFGRDHPDVAASLDNLGNALAGQGELEQARLHHERALRLREELLDRDHPDVATTASNLGGVLHRQGKHDRAELHHRRALQIWEKAYGADHPDLAYALVGLAEVALARGQIDAARAHAERAVSIREASEVAPEDLAEARFLLARALWADRSRRALARELAEHARDAYAEQGKRREVDLAEVEAWLADHRAR